MRKTTNTKAKTTPSTHGFYGEIFFDVPVYRLTKEEYESQQKDYAQNMMRDGGPHVDEMYRRNPEMAERRKGDLWLSYGGPWLFNEIIGFIRLHFYGTQIRGEYWRTDSKKIVRSRKRLFLFREHKVVYEEEIPPNCSSNKIFSLVLKYLTRAKSSLEGRYVDDSVFKCMGPYVNWKALYDSSKQLSGKRTVV